MNLSPRRTWAVVAGIEEYPHLPGWTLPGPAQDAIHFVNWLLARDVPGDQIRLCLSASDADTLTAQLTTHVEMRDARREPVLSLFEHEVSRWEGDLLIVFWGGHGSIDSHDTKEPRRLYFADASPDSPSCLSLDELLRALRHKRRGYFARQAFFIDACATFERRERFSMHAVPVGPAVGTEQDRRVRQFQFLAAGYGEAAINDDAGRTGVFSREFLRVLRDWSSAHPSGSSEWPPNFVDVADAVKRAFDDLMLSGKSTQRPMLIGYDWEGSTLRDSGVSVAIAQRQRRLLRLRGAIEDLNLSTRQLVSLYRATVPLDPKLSSITDLDAIFDSLSRRQAHAAKWPPEAEFCERVRRYWAEHGAPGATGDAPDEKGLLAWLADRECCTPRGLTDLRDKLDDEGPAADEDAAEMRYLVIELAPGETEATPHVAQAWLYRASRPAYFQHCWTTPDLATDRTDVGRVRRLITEAAALGARNLAVEFVTPKEHLGHAPCAWTLESHGIDGGDIGSSYPVAVRWRERLAEPHTVRGRQWERAARRFQDAFRATGVSSIERLPAIVTDHHALWSKMEQGPCGELFWVGHVPLIFEPRHPLMYALLGGAVAVCWSTETLVDEGRASAFLNVLMEVMKGQPFQQLAIELLKGRRSDDAELKDVCAKTVLFCDHLERNPYAASLPSTT